MEENKYLHADSSVFELMPSLYEDALISKDLNNIITDWNDAAHRLFGFSKAEVIGKSIFLIIPEEKRQEERQITSLIENGISVNSFYTVRMDSNNTARYVMLSVAPLLDIEDEVIGVRETVHDITNQRLAEEKQGLLAAIVDSSEDAIISKTLDGIIRSWNAGAEAIFGYKEHEIVGKSIMQIIPADRQNEELSIIEQIKRGEKVNHFETLRLTKDKREIALSITVSPIKNGRGEVIGASKIARDISKEIKVSLQFKDYTERLEKLNAYKDDFIGLASHELKTPLTSISANLQILERKLDEGINKQFVTKTLKHVNKLTNLIAELLDVTKIQSGKLTLNLAEVDIRDVLAEAVENVQLISENHSIQLTDSSNCKVLADKLRIEQVLVNLITNAVKYSPEGNPVLVKCGEHNNEIVCSIQDFGIGIPKDQQENVFTQFSKIEGMNPTSSGLGIGLYISNDIIKRHNGQIWVESEEGIGSTFYFSLPILK